MKRIGRKVSSLSSIRHRPRSGHGEGGNENVGYEDTVSFLSAIMRIMMTQVALGGSQLGRILNEATKSRRMGLGLIITHIFSPGGKGGKMQEKIN
jgi:hypothetical protein